MAGSADRGNPTLFRPPPRETAPGLMTPGHCHDWAGPSIHSFEGRRGADPVRDYHYGLGAACRAPGRHDEAADALRRAVGLEPGRADGHRDLGVAAMPL